MKILLLGRGKTGSLVAQEGRRRGHDVAVVGAAENSACTALTVERLRDVDVVIDFTGPHCVVGHIEACVSAGKQIVVGTTGWYDKLDRIRDLVEKNGTGLVFAANFSVGVNLFYEIARTAGAALKHEYSGQIFERHHAQKKDAPSGTAIAIQTAIREASSHPALEITSFREGDVVGMHEVVLESGADRIYICHDAKSRLGFAEGAVRAAEWVSDKKGFYDFKDIWNQL